MNVGLVHPGAPVRRDQVGHGQDGQALVECLVAMLGLLTLWAAIHWLSQYQDIALSATHASRHAAFLASREMPGGVSPSSIRSFFSGAAHRWVDRRHQRIVSDAESVQLALDQQQRLSSVAQPGGSAAVPEILRREWQLEDAGMLRARVALSFPAPVFIAPPRRLGGLRTGIEGFSSAYPGFARSVSLLTGAGQSRSDSAVQRRVWASALAWAKPYSTSAIESTSISLFATGVDAAWGRSEAATDWLQPWAGQIPPHLLDVPEGEIHAGN